MTNMSPSTDMYRNQAQPASAPYLSFRNGYALPAAILAISSGVASAGDLNIAERTAQYRNSPPYIASHQIGQLSVEALTAKKWSQAIPAHYSGPSDESFAAIAINLAERQKNAPEAIEQILAVHMAELYD